MRGAALLLGAGAGNRLGQGPKAFVELRGMPLLHYAAERAAAAQLVDRVVVTVPAERVVDARRLVGDAEVVAGGVTRQESARIALEAAGDADAVAVHDVARALCPPDVFDRCLDALDRFDAVVATGIVHDTVKRVDGDRVVETLDRDVLRVAQTPQAFRTSVYLAAHDAARRDGFVGTDDASLAERIGIEVRTVEGAPESVKITTAADVRWAEAYLERVAP